MRIAASTRYLSPSPRAHLRIWQFHSLRKGWNVDLSQCLFVERRIKVCGNSDLAFQQAVLTCLPFFGPVDSREAQCMISREIAVNAGARSSRFNWSRLLESESQMT